LQALF